MSAKLEKLDIEVVTDFNLNDDQKQRLASMLAGNGYIDHRGGFISADKTGARRAVRIHLTGDESRAIDGSLTGLDGVDDIHFDRPAHLLLEDETGEMTGMQAAKGEIGATWCVGVVLNVDGDVWFCGYDDIGSVPDGTQADAPVLKKISREASDHPGSEPFNLDDLPMEGEFWISHEQDPHIVSIPWSSGYAGYVEPGDTNADRIESRAKERAVLEAITERVRALEAGSEPEML